MSETRPVSDRLADAPFTGRFTFEIDDVEIGAFTEVSGLQVQVEVEELIEGGNNGFVHKLPGRMTWPNIVLKRGVTTSDALFEWLNRSAGQATGGSTMERSTGKITVLDAARQPHRTWSFEHAFPVRWSGPTLAASSSEIAVEELEIAHHGFLPS